MKQQNMFVLITDSHLKIKFVVLLRYFSTRVTCVCGNIRRKNKWPDCMVSKLPHIDNFHNFTYHKPAHQRSSKAVAVGLKANGKKTKKTNRLRRLQRRNIKTKYYRRK